jgi:hypothetical protein
MFTLDFDIRNELEKRSEELGAPKNPLEIDGIDMSSHMAEHILDVLMAHATWKKFRYAVMSGNGLHVHYFGEPVEVNKDLWVAGMKTIFEEISAITPIPCDFGCGNAGRIMRMPGSWNNKGEKKPVYFTGWMPENSLPHMSFVQERGDKALERQNELKERARAEFETVHPEGGSSVIDLINQIPIEQIVFQLLGCRVSQHKRDGGLRFVDEHGKERGFFKHQRHNIVVHEGTALFAPPVGTGYNCFGLVKAVLKITSYETVQWCAERSAVVRDAQDKEHDAWAKENEKKEFVFADEIRKKL